MEVVRADKQPFMAAIGSMEAKYCDQEFSSIKFTRRRKYGSQGKHTWTQRILEIQKEEAKLLKVTTIVPYKPMSGPIIEEIDDD